VCVTANQQDTETKPNPNPTLITKQHTIVNILVTCSKYLEKVTRENVIAPFIL